MTKIELTDDERKKRIREARKGFIEKSHLTKREKERLFDEKKQERQEYIKSKQEPSEKDNKSYTGRKIIIILIVILLFYFFWRYLLQ